MSASEWLPCGPWLLPADRLRSVACIVDISSAAAIPFPATSAMAIPSCRLSKVIKS
jgi:hypothetical protein